MIPQLIAGFQSTFNVENYIILSGLYFNFVELAEVL